MQHLGNDDLFEIAPIHIPNAAELVAQKLRMEIVRGKLPSGKWLPTQDQMANMFGISRNTMRDALRILQAEGLVEVKQGRGGGVQVKWPSNEVFTKALAIALGIRRCTFADIHEFRLMFEVACAGMAAKRCDETSLTVLQNTVVELEGYIQDHILFMKKNSSFHSLIVEASGNSVFKLIMGSVHELVDKATHQVQLAVKEREKIVKAHRKIMDAISAKDAEKAELYMRRHLEGFLPNVTQHYGKELSQVILFEE